jgi:hypothetical protein
MSDPLVSRYDVARYLHLAEESICPWRAHGVSRSVKSRFSETYKHADVGQSEEVTVSGKGEA